MKLTGSSSRSFGRARAQLSKVFGGAFSGALENRLHGHKNALDDAEAAEQSKHRLKRVLNDDRELLDDRPDGALLGDAAAAEFEARDRRAERAAAVETAEAAEESKRRLAHLLKRDRKLLSGRPSGSDREDAELREVAAASARGAAAPASASAPAVDPALEHTFAELLASSAPKPAPAANPSVAGLWAGASFHADQSSAPAPSEAEAAALLTPRVYAQADVAKDSAATGSACREPIRTRSMARLLASQGHHDRALAIYTELLAANSGDDSLRAEADALRPA